MVTIRKNKWGKWLILTVGFIFISYGIFLGSLAFFGTETNAKITSYRKQLGERNETIPNQYTYLYGYEFNYKGKTYRGTGQQIGGPIVLKNEGNSYLKVRFLKLFPQINSIYENRNTILNLFVSMGVGLGLIYLARKMN